MPDPDPLAALDRSYGNTHEELRISVDEYNGKRYVSLRVWFKGDRRDDWLPSKKGITIRPKELGPVCEALEKAAGLL